jgi:ribosomal protein S18 acetylase RimI-like enzyme
VTAEVRIWNGDSRELHLAADLYADVFAEPPYDEEHETSRATFLDRVDRYRVTKPNFRLQLAWHDQDVVGLALGTGISAGDWWRDRIIPQLAADTADEWFGDETFAVVELATSSAHRRNGVASALVAALLEALPYPTAVLSAYCDAESARRFYRANGWQELAQRVRLGESRELCLFGKRIGATPAH